MTYINYQLNTNYLDTDDLINIIEHRGYTVQMPGEVDENAEAHENMHDEIHALYLNYVSGEDLDKCLKKFFEDTIDIRIL